MALLGMHLTGLECVSCLHKMQNFQDSSTQLLNIVDVLLGGFQANLPKTNFTKILFISFAFFCIIIRTIQQGSMFKLMQSEDLKNQHERRDDRAEIQIPRQHRFWGAHEEVQ
jgi:hypothetical protein